jgi:6-phosphofructokinase 1
MESHTGRKEKSPASPRVLGILVGGGPAPGINGVISAATIEATNQGMEVVGILDGFKWLSMADTSHCIPLSIENVSRIHIQGGSILRTSRENPTKSEEKMNNVISSLEKLDVKYLMSIGGDDTAYSSNCIAKSARGKIRVVHVPKTIDNDLPLPINTYTFGFQTARHVGVQLVKNMMEDAKTTGRWYIIVTMGRKAGHLALGIGTAAGVTLTIIGEEFDKEKITLSEICDIIEGGIIKRMSMGRMDGVAILAEGLSEKLSPEEVTALRKAGRDEHGHIQLGDIDLGKIVREELIRRFESRGIKTGIVVKNIGYELRSADPIPFDLEYTRTLGFGAVRFLMSGDSGAMISLQAGKIIPIYFEDLIDPSTGKTRVRLVDIHTEAYAVSREYMIRLEKEDFMNPEKTAKLAAASHMTPARFRKKFEYLGQQYSFT